MTVMDKFMMDGRCAIVTGAAMGLGKAMATALAEAGCSIIIADINLEAADKAACEIRSRGVDAFVVQCDVTVPEDAEKTVAYAVKRFGRLDVLVNNAGICRHEKAEDMSMKDWHDVMRINLDGVFIMSQYAGRAMISQKKGSIINIASMSGLIVNTPQNQCGYNASKAGVIMLTKSLATEWAQHDVRVNAIAPGYMKTEMTRPYFEENGEMVRRWMSMSPAKRPGEPDELGGIVLYLASDASSFTTGGVFVVDGGYSVW